MHGISVTEISHEVHIDCEGLIECCNDDDLVCTRQELCYDINSLIDKCDFAQTSKKT